MKKLIAVIIFSLSVNAVACDGVCREPSVVGTPVSADLEREIASVANLGKTEIAENFCNYGTMNSATSFDLFKNDLQELRVASVSFNEIATGYRCDSKKILLHLVEQDSMHGHHAFVQAFFDGLYQEGGMALVKQHLNSKDYYDSEVAKKVSIVEFVRKRIDKSIDPLTKSHWTSMYNYIIQFA